MQDEIIPINTTKTLKVNFGLCRCKISRIGNIGEVSILHKNCFKHENFSENMKKSVFPGKVYNIS